MELIKSRLGGLTLISVTDNKSVWLMVSYLAHALLPVEHTGKLNWASPFLGLYQRPGELSE